FAERMAGSAVDGIFKGLRIPAKRDLSQRGHWQQPSKGIESLLLENGVLLVKVVPKPFLKWVKQRNVSIEQRIDGSRVFRQQPKLLQIGPGNVVQVLTANF